ncbi:MAG: hypothetical protein Q4P84_00070 [Elusimicrobiales bacterium]|uniref:phage tail fiber protein n=1 Tax=Candidatus Avelusimicrobium sp. TaxID=3048833 RepID=UPI001B596116|nr:hypothetical protein [Elusimicrobiaceae bacterium]MDO5764082.1 hypothetical protein [Elusimicrobiales bacterium]
MQDVSFIGGKVTVIAAPTFPQGFEISEFADDADPLDFPAAQIAEYGMGVNGDLVVWTRAAALEVTLNIIPNSDADKNLSILYDMNRAAKGKISAQDVITLVASYPDGTRKILSNGKLVSGVPAGSASSNGRIKTKEYKFVFENKIN